MVYSNLSSKTAEEIVKIVSSASNYQKQYVIAAYQLGKEKGYVPDDLKCPYPICEDDLGRKLFTYHKPTTFSKFLYYPIWIRIFLGIIYLSPFIAYLYSDEGAIVCSVMPAFFLFILFLGYLNYLRYVDEVVLYQYGIEIKKKEKKILLYHREVITVNVTCINKKAGKWDSVLQTQNDGPIKVRVDEMERFLNFFDREKIKVIPTYS
jgi:hypothetical protein